MKRYITLTACLLGWAFFGHGQNVHWGITGGFASANLSTKQDNTTETTTNSGFYAGGFAYFEVNSGFGVHSELLFAGIEDANAILIPILAEFKLTDQLSLSTGPQFNFSLEEIPDGFTGLSFGAASGIGFDISYDLRLKARYAYQFSNSFTGDDDIKVRTHFWTIGLGYRFL